MAWSKLTRREKAQAVAIASVLVVLAVYLAINQMTLRELVGLLVIAPSAIMLAYYIVATDENDRGYNIGLYTVITAVGLLILGVRANVVIAGLLIAIAILIILGTGKRGGK